MLDAFTWELVPVVPANRSRPALVRVVADVFDWSAYEAPERRERRA